MAVQGFVGDEQIGPTLSVEVSQDGTRAVVAITSGVEDYSATLDEEGLAQHAHECMMARVEMKRRRAHHG